MPRASGPQGIHYLVDFDSIAVMIGAMEAAADVANTDRYIAKLIKSAHDTVSDEFDSAFVASAMASSVFSHMFEWGTAGINNGRTTRRMSPNNKESHLWEHDLIGSGKNQSITYRFLPSKVPVPQPTTTKTGISQKYLSRLNGKHIFWNKAAIMEAGTPVHIAPKNAGKLFIPLMGWNGPNLRPQDKARGFIMTSKGVTVTPGGEHIGAFNAYWERFWQGQGNKDMQEHMEAAFTKHLDTVRKKAESVRGKLTPAGANNLSAKVAEGRTMASSSMIEQATADEKKRGVDGR